MKLPVHESRRDDSASSTRSHQSTALFPTCLQNSRCHGINYEYILGAAGAGIGGMEYSSPLSGDNDRRQDQSTAWIDTGKEKKGLA